MLHMCTNMSQLALEIERPVLASQPQPGIDSPCGYFEKAEEDADRMQSVNEHAHPQRKMATPLCNRRSRTSQLDM